LLGALVVTLVAVPAIAGELTVNAFAGPGALAVQKQVSRAVCDDVQCVPAPKNKKAKKKPAILNGKVVKGKKVTNLEVWLVGTNGKQAWKKTWPLAAGKLTPENLAKVTEQVVKSVGAKAPPPAPPEPKAEPARTAPPPDSSSSSATSASSSSSSSSSSSGSSSSTASAAEPKKEGGDDWAKAEAKPAKAVETSDEPAASASTSTTSSSDGAGTLPTIFASVNMDLMSRGFAYDNLSTANLHEYKGFPIAAPHIHLDVYPLARVVDGWLQGLGLEADVAFTLGLKAVAGSIDFPSQIMRLNGALKFRIPLTSGGIAVYPAVGFNYASFSLSPSKTSTTLDGLPEVAYLGLKLGAGLDAPLLDDKLRLGLGINYLPVFAAGEVISASYFPEGSVWGLGVNASAGYRILSPLEIRLGFALERYALSFKTLPTDTYKANGASDLLWSLSLGIGVVW
ncbi:MAG TPA: hypothetical protein VGK67_02940, partial [Myxococcales bacterium]